MLTVVPTPVNPLSAELSFVSRGQMIVPTGPSATTRLSNSATPRPSIGPWNFSGDPGRAMSKYGAPAVSNAFDPGYLGIPRTSPPMVMIHSGAADGAEGNATAAARTDDNEANTSKTPSAPTRYGIATPPHHPGCR